jgi:hypothetical protein
MSCPNCGAPTMACGHSNHFCYLDTDDNSIKCSKCDEAARQTSYGQMVPWQDTIKPQRPFLVEEKEKE